MHGGVTARLNEHDVCAWDTHSVPDGTRDEHPDLRRVRTVSIFSFLMGAFVDDFNDVRVHRREPTAGSERQTATRMIGLPRVMSQLAKSACFHLSKSLPSINMASRASSMATLFTVTQRCEERPRTTPQRRPGTADEQQPATTAGRWD